MYPVFSPTMESLPLPDQKYNLRWPDYHNSVLETFRSLKEEEDFIDVTLSCEEQQYSAHKVVLSACSPYFRKLLKSNPCQHPIIILRDVREEDLRLLLNFMYQGEVQVEQDRISTFLQTAETLQIKGLTDHPLKEQCQKTSSTTSLPTTTTHPGIVLPEQQEADDYSPLLKRPRHSNGGRDDSPPPLPCRESPISPNRHNGDGRKPWGMQTSPGIIESSMVDSSVHKYDKYGERESTDINGDSKSLLSQALEKTGGERQERRDRQDSRQDDRDDSGSDTTGASDRGGSASIDTVKSEMMNGEGMGGHIFPPGLEALYRQAGFPPFLGSLGGPGHHGGSPGSLHGLGGHGGLPGPSTTHIGLQSHAANPTMGGKLEMMRVRATDPRPCPKCGKIYRSAHTLRTHMEDKHTICPGYRCVLCGTVAKSRNSLHSHMSRQHRGISTKDLPVVPMPAPFDPELASKLLSKVSPNELAARASPTAPRRSDLPKLDNNLSIHHQNHFPLPPSLPPAHLNHLNNIHRDHNRDHHSDPEDLRVPITSPNFSSPHHFSHNSPHSMNSMAPGMKPPAPGFGGSALLDTYLAMISAADGNVAAAAAALNFQNSPAARAAAMAAAQLSAAGMMPGGLAGLNGKDHYGSDREDGEGELGSDAENDDISDNEEPEPQRGPSVGLPLALPVSTAVGIPVNNGDHM